MSKQQALLKKPVLDGTLNALIVDAIQDIKGKKIILMDLRKLDDRPTDFFVICEGESFVQVKSIANNVGHRVKKEMGMLPNHVEGAEESKWVLVDFFDTVLHVFYPETREFYDIEDLWSDAECTYFEDL